VYLTSAEWNALHRGKMVKTFEENLKRVYPQKFDLIYDRSGSKVHSIEVLLEDGHLDAITERNVVSTLIHTEYYRHLDRAHRLVKELTSEINLENIKRLWWILRFRRLSQLSLTGFNQPDLTSEEIEHILRYINYSHLLERLNLTEYVQEINGTIQLSDSVKKVYGQIPFLNEDSMLMVKCSSGGSSSLDLTWLQTFGYHRLLPKITTVYIYNPLTGQLWRKNVQV